MFHQHSLHVGLALGLAEIGYGLLFRLADLHYTSAMAWVFYAMLVVAAAWAAVLRGRASGASMVRIFAAAAGAVALGAAIYAGFVYVFNAFVDDSLLQTVRADQMAQLREAGADDDAIAAVTRLTEPGPFALSVFVQMLVVGVLSAALAAVAVVVRRKRVAQGAMHTPT